MSSFLDRLKERKLVQWVLAYVAGAWLILEILGHAGKVFGWPAAVDSIGLILAGGGLFVALVLAWYHGEMGKQRISGPELLIIALLLGISGGVVSLLRPDAEEGTAGIATTPDADKPRFALLLCENISPDPDDAYIAAGIHEEILSMLEKISGLTSLGRKTVETYKEDSRPLPEKAQEMGVAYLGECSVRKAPNAEEISITVRLLDAGGGGVWSETYNRDMSAGSYFEILSDVATRFATEIGAFLTPEEESRLSLRPTENSEAWDLYLRGREYYVRPGFRGDNFAEAEKLWARAIELDPEFALARAKLSFLHGRTYYLGYDRAPQRLVAQEHEAAEATRLQPALAEALFAKGYVAYVQGDLEGALEGFRLAQKAAPNDPVTAAFTGYTYRRIGAWEDWEETWKRTLSLNPRNVDMYFNLGGHTLFFLGRYEEAATSYARAIELAPDLHEAAISKGFVYSELMGSPDSLRAVLSSLPEEVAIRHRLTLALWDRDVAGIMRWAGASPEIMIRQTSTTSRHVMLAWAHLLRGEDAQAEEAFDLARIRLEENLAETDDFRLHYGLGLAYAGLGLADEAASSAEAHRRDAPFPPEDIYFRCGVDTRAAEVMAQAGRAEEAVELLAGCEKGVWGAGLFGLRIDPIWDPIRDDPAFQNYLEILEGRGG